MVTAEARDLYVASYARLVGVLSVAAGSRAEAEDVVQEAFVRLLPEWHRVSRFDDPEAWVRKVAFRLLWRRLRRRRRDEAPLATNEKATDGLSTDRVDIARAVATLPLQHRQVIVMHYLLDMSVEAIAGELEVRTGTVKSRLARARTRLGPLLQDGERS